MKSCFQTQSYRGHYIHSHYDRNLKREVFEIQVMRPDGGFTLYSAKSLRAAKCKITRIIGGQIKPKFLAGTRAFSTLEAARAYCREVFEQTGIVLALENSL